MTASRFAKLVSGVVVVLAVLTGCTSSEGQPSGEALAQARKEAYEKGMTDALRNLPPLAMTPAECFRAGASAGWTAGFERGVLNGEVKAHTGNLLDDARDALAERQGGPVTARSKALEAAYAERPPPCN